jgi:hypothetical protein
MSASCGKCSHVIWLPPFQNAETAGHDGAWPFFSGRESRKCRKSRTKSRIATAKRTIPPTSKKIRNEAIPSSAIQESAGAKGQTHKASIAADARVHKAQIA